LGITLSNFARELAAAIEEEVRVVGTVREFRLTEVRRGTSQRVFSQCGVQELHRRGINMRYLGLLVARLGKWKYSKFLVAHLCARIIKVCLAPLSCFTDDN
jgi:hypothetical protein